MVNRKFLGWHIIPNLSRACYAIRSMVHISIINTLKSMHASVLLCNMEWSVAVTQEWEDFHFAKENLQNYG